MKKKSKVFLFSVCVFCGLAGCSNKETEENVVTVCTEESVKMHLDTIAKLWEKQNKGARIEFLVLPPNTAENEIKLSELRTEIMSGEGPDIFILSGINPMASEKQNVLFPNPEKIMYTDTFLPLDEYIQDAKYMNLNNWNSTIMKAGQTEEGQVILPLYYEYGLYAYPGEMGEMIRDFPDNWNDLMNTENEMLQCDLWGTMAIQFRYAVGKIADYEQEKLLLSEDMLTEQLEKAFVFSEAGSKLTEEIQSAENMNKVLAGPNLQNTVPLLKGEKDKTHALWPVKNIDSGITANVTLYAAVNRNTEQPEEAFSFLDTLLSDEIMTGQGMKENDIVYGAGFLAEKDQFPVHENALEKKLEDINAQDANQIREMNKQIETVRFYSDIEKTLADSYMEAAHFKPEDHMTMKDFAKKRYDLMKMQLQE